MLILKNQYFSAALLNSVKLPVTKEKIIHREVLNVIEKKSS